MLAKNPYLGTLIGFVLMLAISLGAKEYIESIGNRAVDRQVKFAGDQIAMLLSSHVEGNLRMLDQLRKRKERGEFQDEIAFINAAATILDNFPEFLGINLIDENRKIVAVYPFARNAPALGQRVGQSQQIIALLDESIRTRTPKATTPLKLFQGGIGIATYFPVFVDDKFSGFVNGLFRGEQLLGEILAEAGDASLSIKILDDSDVIFDTASDRPSSGHSSEHQIRFLDRHWTIKLEASMEFPGMAEIAREKTITLVIVMLSSLFVGALILLIARSQQALVESRKKFEDFAASSSDWFWEQDEKLRFTYVSQSNAAISGQSPVSHYGKTRRETKPLGVSDDSWARHDQDLAARRPLVDFEFSRIDARGKTRFLSVSGKPYMSDDGRFLGYRGTGRDITERKNAETAIRLMSTIVDQSPVSVIVTDPLGNITYVNPAFTEATGYARDEAIGKNPRLLQSGLTKPEVYRDLWATLNRGEAWRGEFYNKTKSGETTWEQAAIAPIRDKSGEVTHYVAVMENVTFRKNLESELIEAKDKAVSANLAKSKFLAMMSHELRTPLNAVIGFAQMLHNQSFGKIGNERYVDYAGDIENSGRHLLDLLNDVLDVAKIETGSYPLDVRAYRLSGIVKNLTSAMLSMAKGAGHASAFKVDDDVRALCDRRAVRQILLNLVSNAVKYTERGGEIEVSVEAAAGGKAVLSVKDNGIGMSKEGVARATEMFERLDNDMRAKPEGVGIGLYMVKQLTDKMGATLDIRSEPGVGTTVSVTFDAAPAFSETAIG